jgi:hypothetical protein
VAARSDDEYENRADRFGQLSAIAILRQLSLRDTANSSAFIDLPLHRA